MDYTDHTANLTSATVSRSRDISAGWTMLPVMGDVQPGELVGFDTLEQAQAVAAGLTRLEMARAV